MRRCSQRRSRGRSRRASAMASRSTSLVAASRSRCPPSSTAARSARRTARVVVPLAMRSASLGCPDVSRVLIAVQPGSEDARGGAHARADGRLAVRPATSTRGSSPRGRDAEQPVDGAVRRDLRARRVPLHVQRDAAHGARAASRDRGAPNVRVLGVGRRSGDCARRTRAGPVRVDRRRCARRSALAPSVPAGAWIPDARLPGGHGAHGAVANSCVCAR